MTRVRYRQLMFSETVCVDGEVSS